MELKYKRKFKATLTYELELSEEVFEGQEYPDIIEKFEKEIEGQVDGIVDIYEKEHPYLWLGQMTCTEGEVEEIELEE
jgi:hypothetical protein